MPDGAAARFRFGFEEVRPPADDVEVVLGYPRQGSPGAVAEAIGGVLASTEDLWAIEGGFVEYPRLALEDSARALGMGGLRFEVGEVLTGQLRHASAVAVFVCTAGPGVERLTRELTSSGDPFTGYIADAVGSLVVDRAMDRVHERIEAQAAARGLRVTNRYSPGYCGWKVEEQQKLFRLLPPGFCGVSLNDSSLMHPIKSVSGVIGLGRQVRRNPYTCQLCGRGDCLYRSLQESPDRAGIPAR